MKTETIDAPSPCEGAVQIGSTSELRAVWQKGDKTFMVFHDAQSRMHVKDVSPTVITRKREPPIPWDSLQNSIIPRT
tara:strand:+ start:1812 stop:2042 length:231 start_codon:yes stop_codon:yes gene_type:complete